MGADLYPIVGEYFDLGHHRTGSPVDHATIEWIADRLAELGLSVSVEWLDFDRFTYESSLTVDGTPIEHLPVFYEWTGDLSTASVHVSSVDPKSGGVPGVLADGVAEAKGVGRPALLATDHPLGSLVAVNRPERSGSGHPTVLVAGRDRGRLEQGRIALDLHARIEPGRTANVVATNGRVTDGAVTPLMLTTPHNGWFGCAGERGTGIAVWFDLVERLADRPVLAVATAGHELGYFGADQWEAGDRPDPRAVVHVGASVAVEEPSPGGDRGLTAMRLAMTSEGETAAEPMRAALEPARLSLGCDTRHWIGEGEVWTRMGRPLLSFTGAGVDFHTPEDTPARATSPESLRLVADAIGAATSELDDLARTR